MFGKVDTEAQPELACKFDIRSIPTIMAIRDGVIVFAQPGALPESALESLIEKVASWTWTRCASSWPSQSG